LRQRIRFGSLSFVFNDRPSPSGEGDFVVDFHSAALKKMSGQISLSRCRKLVPVSLPEGTQPFEIKLA
jgi:hypothetical protein